MKTRLFFILMSLICSSSVLAQNPAIEKQLKDKYKVSNVSYDKDAKRFSIKKDGKVCLCDEKGKELLPLTNRYSTIYAEVKNDKIIGYHTLAGELPNLKCGFCDINFIDIISPTKYTKCYPDYDDKGKKIVGFHVGVGNLSGYCDANGREIIAPIKYTSVRRSEDYFYVSIGDKNGVCDLNGLEILTPSKYSFVMVDNDYYNGTSLGFSVQQNGKYGFLDLKGREIIRIQYDWVSPMYDANNSFCGFTIVNNGKTGICDKSGREIIPPIHDGIIPFKDEGKTFFVSSNNGVLFDENFQIIAQGYEEMGYPKEGLCYAKKNGKYGFISSKSGEVVIPFIYDKVESFGDDVAKVTKNGKTEMIPNPLKVVAENNQPKVKGKAISTYPAPDSDVDKNIPTGKKADNSTHAFIIANENYPVAKVPYALNDGWMFEQYCKKTLGIKEENVHLYEDATGGNIMACVEEMKQTAQAANGQATIIFYYAGHAFPDEEKSTAYLLPIDGDSKNTSTGYSLENLYKEMNKVQVKQMVCFLDACFSGATRDDQMLITGRGVTIKVKDEIPQGNMVVMTSATGAETAHSYEEMHHGLFTYFLLQKLQETKGDVTLGDLSEYVTKMVKRESVVINRKKQTPTVIPSPKLQGTWQEMKL